MAHRTLGHRDDAGSDGTYRRLTRRGAAVLRLLDAPPGARRARRASGREVPTARHHAPLPARPSTRARTQVLLERRAANSGRPLRRGASPPETLRGGAHALHGCRSTTRAPRTRPALVRVNGCGVSRLGVFTTSTGRPASSDPPRVASRNVASVASLSPRSARHARRVANVRAGFQPCSHVRVPSAHSGPDADRDRKAYRPQTLPLGEAAEHTLAEPNEAARQRVIRDRRGRRTVGSAEEKAQRQNSTCTILASQSITVGNDPGRSRGEPNRNFRLTIEQAPDPQGDQWRRSLLARLLLLILGPGGV